MDCVLRTRLQRNLVTSRQIELKQRSVRGAGERERHRSDQARSRPDVHEAVSLRSALWRSINVELTRRRRARCANHELVEFKRGVWCKRLSGAAARVHRDFTIPDGRQVRRSGGGVLRTAWPRSGIGSTRHDQSAGNGSRAIKRHTAVALRRAADLVTLTAIIRRRSPVEIQLARALVNI